MKRNRIKVLYLINSMAQGGAERQMAELVRRLPRDRFTPVLCSLTDENAYSHLLPPGQPQYTLDDSFSINTLVRLLRIIRAERPHIVHSFMEYANLLNRLVSPASGSPIVITSVRSRMMSPKYRLIEALLATRCHTIVVNSIGTRDELVRWQQVPSEKIRVISNIIDFDRFVPQDVQTREQARNELGLRGLTFLIPGRISLAKNQLGLAIAIGRLKRQGALPKDTTFLLAGRVFNGAILNALPLLYRYYGISKELRYIGPIKKVEGLYAAADWVMLPSLWEGLPNAAIEAHACEKPLLLNYESNVDGIMADGVTGYAYQTFWIDGMVSAIKRAVETPPAIRESMGREGRKRVLERYDPDKVLSENIGLYDELLHTYGGY